MYLFRIIPLCLMFFATIPCAQNNSSHDLSIKVNDEAMDLLKLHQDTLTQNKALKLLDSSIILNNHNYTAYGNKVSILLSMKRVNEAYQILEKVNSQEKQYTFLMLHGFISERAYKDTLKAQQDYSMALNLLDSACGVEPQNKSLDLNRAFLTLFIKGKMEGIEMYNMLLDKYKNDKAILSMKEEFYDFNRAQYLQDLW